MKKLKDYNLRHKYGISLEEKKIKWLYHKNNKCLICDKEFKNSRSTHLDHCHVTGQIRGILCHVCNTKLSWYENYKHKIEEYLNKPII